MTIAKALQFALLQRRSAPGYSDRFCRRIMRGWARCWRVHRLNKEQFELAELALGNALAWRDRAEWSKEDLGLSGLTDEQACSGRVMSTPGIEAGGDPEATTPPASF